MKLSKLVLALSAGVNAFAASLSAKVVVPSLRAAGDLKQKGLNCAFNEHDKEYWRHVDSMVASREFLKSLEAKMKEVEGGRRAALFAAKRFPKERIL